MTDFSKLLNPEQFAAATAGDGPLLVLAAAGTGKTRTLVHRVACLRRARSSTEWPASWNAECPPSAQCS